MNNTINAEPENFIENQNLVLRNSYLLLAITLVPTILGAFVGKAFPLTEIIGLWSLAIYIPLVFIFNSLVYNNKDSVVGIFWLLGFTFFMGYITGPAIGFAMGNYENGLQLIGTAIGGTIVMFFALATFASNTSRNLSNPEILPMIIIGMIMLLIGSVLNLFIFQMPLLALGISTAVAIIASIMIVFTINSVVRGGVDNYVIVTMTLYIMLLNIFQWILNLLMVFAGEED